VNRGRKRSLWELNVNKKQRKNKRNSVNKGTKLRGNSSSKLEDAIKPKRHPNIAPLQ